MTIQKSRVLRDGQYRARLLLAVSCVVVAFGAQGQGTGSVGMGLDAQEQARQQERERALREAQERTPDVRLEPSTATDMAAYLPVAEQPCFPIEHIALEGEASEDFQWALRAAERPDDPATGRCLGAQGINLVMARIQNAIVDHGYITTRVLASPQDLAQGTLTLTLLPGRIRAIRLAEPADPRARLWNARPMSPGDLLDLRDIEQMLENLKRVPTADADIQIEPATGDDALPGQSDIVVRYGQGFPWRVVASVDDGGTRATGKYQGSLTVSYDHWWTLNDLFYASLSHDLGGGEPGRRGSRADTLHYSVPYGYWLFSVTASRNRYYQSVAGLNQTYEYSGESRQAEFRLSRLLWRDASNKLSAHVRVFKRRSRNYIDDTEIEVQRRATGGWEAGLSHRAYLGRAVLDASLAYRHGTGAFGALPAPEEAFGEGTSRFRLITADLSLGVPFQLGPLQLRYAGLWRAQFNRTPLSPQERFAIGGRYTVRGFDGESTLMAERGWLWRNDLGLALGNTGQEFYLGVDAGRVGGQSAQWLLGRTLVGGVIGVRGGWRGLQYDLFGGLPLRKPDGFQTASKTAGFSLSYQF